MTTCAPAEPDDNEEKNLWQDDKPTDDQKLVRKEMNECIRDVVNKLPEQYGAVVVLSEMECLSDSEIAEVLGISLENVKVRLHRGRSMLKKALDERCNFYRDERNEFACEPKDPDK